MALMADDVVLMPPNEPVLKGKPAVRAWYDQFLTQLRTSGLTISDREVVIGGEWATEIAGRWVFSRELWNSAAPPASASKGT
jgi:ketosteroid isomerase-like protein